MEPYWRAFASIGGFPPVPGIIVVGHPSYFHRVFARAMVNVHYLELFYFLALCFYGRGPPGFGFVSTERSPMANLPPP